MLRIECPYCGPRDEPEFVFGGPSHLIRPRIDCSDRDWTDYLYFRDNCRGLVCERWCHSFGCGQWFNVVRDTVTHAIGRTYRMGDPRPDLNDPLCG